MKSERFRGALVAPNGSVRLSRATTLVAWHAGVERYVSSFSYQGDFSNLGWIVPLPAVPMNIEEGEHGRYSAWNANPTRCGFSLASHPLQRHQTQRQCFSRSRSKR